MDLLNDNDNQAGSPKATKYGISSSQKKKANIQKPFTVHQAIAEGVELVLRKSAAFKSLDNITTLVIGFKNFKKTVK